MKDNMSIIIETPRLSEKHISHRNSFEGFVTDGAEGPVAEFVKQLFTEWHNYNEKYFYGKMIVPYINLAQNFTTKRVGEFAPSSSWGGKSEIRIRPTLFTGKHPMIHTGAPMEGRKRYMFDILLHESIHQYCQEILGDPEASYKGHGPVFKSECNRISGLMGLTGLVRDCKARGKNRDLPGCQYWPHCVRPDDYYMGAIGKRIKHRTSTAIQNLNMTEIIDQVCNLYGKSQILKIAQTLTERANRTTFLDDKAKSDFFFKPQSYEFNNVHIDKDRYSIDSA